MPGTTQEYYIKGGNYKSVTNGTLVQWQLYIEKDLMKILGHQCDELMKERHLDQLK